MSVDVHVLDGSLQLKNGKICTTEEENLELEKGASLNLHGTELDSEVFSHLTETSVPVHFFDMYGKYRGTFYPRERSASGELLIRQAEHHIDPEKKLELARRIAIGAHESMKRSLDSLGMDGGALGTIETSLDIKTLRKSLKDVEDAYMLLWISSLPADFREDGGGQDAKNALEALLNLGNSLMYSAALTALYHSHLNPAIPFLHETSDSRFPMALDISRIFAPLLVNRLISDLLVSGIIGMNDFDERLSHSLLKPKGKRVFIERWNRMLGSEVYHRGLHREASMRSLIEIECYKIEMHLIGGNRYRALRTRG